MENERKEELKDEMKNKISMALKDPTLQQEFEIICKELEAEKKLNAEIKARFVKCNTCTDEMKSKCLMFSESLCQGERCEELVDLMGLISKSELEKENAELKLKLEALEGQTPWKDIKDKSEVIGKLTKAKEIIKGLLIVFPYDMSEEELDSGDKDMVEKAEEFLNSEVEK